MQVEVRTNNLRDYLQRINDKLEYKIVPISDPFGPAIEDASLQVNVTLINSGECPRASADMT